MDRSKYKTAGRFSVSLDSKLSCILPHSHPQYLCEKEDQI